MTSTNKEYKLCAELSGHTNDVRCLAEAAFPPNTIVSGSRDGSVRLWHSEGGIYRQYHVLEKQHVGFISSLLVAPGDDTFPLGRIYSGGQDKMVRMYASDPPELLWSMEGHKDTVCALAWDAAQRVLVSGSWDKTARIWRDRDCISILSGHEATVWAVAVVPTKDALTTTCVLTGSADKTIKLWKDAKVVKTFQGHTDCVRGLAVMSDIQFLSCANDTMIKLWNIITGDCLKNFIGHEAYIYSISLLPTGYEFVTGSEDRTLRVWSLQSDTPTQTIKHPAQSIWAVLGMNNGDAVSGTSDSAVRVFTRDPVRQADGDILSLYTSQVESFVEASQASADQEASKELGGIKIADLPGPEALYIPGDRDGKTKMVNNKGTVVLYEWSAADTEWKKIGDVMSAKGPADGKKMFEGKEYDYVFDVDVDTREGAPALKLPYNLSDDPWFAAQIFIDSNELPRGYLDQIAQFIITNAPGAGQKSTASEYRDPFTGASSYVPGVTPSTGPSGFSDPLTGGGRYIPQTGAGAASNSGFGAGSDPLTGTGRYVPKGQAPDPSVSIDPKRPRSEHVPISMFVKFTATSPKTIEKLKEFNSIVPAGVALPQEKLDALEILSKTTGHEASVDALLIKSFEIGFSWPPCNLIPLLDLFQQAIHRSPPLADHFFRVERGKQLVDFLLGLTAPAAGDNGGATPATPPPGLLICVGRVLSNAFSTTPGRKIVSACGHFVIPILWHSGLASDRPNAQAAATACITNLAHQEFTHGTSHGRLLLSKKLMDGFEEGLDRQYLSEATITGLARALATLMWGDETTITGVKNLPKCKQIITRLKDRIQEEGGKHDVRCIERMCGYL